MFRFKTEDFYSGFPTAVGIMPSEAARISNALLDKHLKALEEAVDICRMAASTIADTQVHYPYLTRTAQEWLDRYCPEQKCPPKVNLLDGK